MLDRLLPGTPPQVRMHHSALDRSGPHDRDLDDEVVEAPRTQPGQHRHLRAALDLEDAHGVGRAESVVHARVLRGDRRQAIDGALPASQDALEDRPARDREVQRLADRREHAQAEDIDLEEAERVEVVLVPGDHGAPRHRRRLDGSDVHERLRAEHEAPDVDRQVARIALDRVGHREHLADAQVLRLEPARRDALVVDLVELVPPRDQRAEAVHLLERQAEGLPHFAERALAAVRDDLAHHRGVVAAVGVVDGLNDLFAALVLEIDVDVRRLAALRGEEALEEQVAARRIDRRDAEAVADGAVRRAAAPLAEDVARRAPSRRWRARSGSTARPRAR